MANLGSAYVQIIPSADGIKGKIEKQLGGEDTGRRAGNRIGKGLVAKIGGIMAAASIGTMIVKGISASVKEGAALEQSLGGIETLFKDNADTVIKNASKAYKTAGMSANEYMENVTSFSASLLQSLGGDTAAAAKTSDMALTDMSDNANKFGTSMTSITDAYQGFAKQNYTMLDNLKLGYGGTKTEMERLLADATKISGVEYDISSLDDVYNAIHVIQEEMGVTGTTAEEASKTLSGSFNSMKAAGKDLLGNLALGKDIGPSLQALVETASTFLFKNLFPAIGNIMKQLPKAIGTVIKEGGPEFAKSALNILKSIGQGIMQNAPVLFQLLSKGLSKAIAKIASWDPTETGRAGQSIMTKIGQALQKYFPVVMKAIGVIIGKLLLLLIQLLPRILVVIGMMLGKLGLFLLQKLGQLAMLIPTAIAKLLVAVWQKISQTAVKAWGAVKNAILTPIRAIKNAIVKIWTRVKTFLSTVWNSIKAVAKRVWTAIKTAVTAPVKGIWIMIKTIWKAIKAFLRLEWNGIKTIAKTIWNAIKKVIINPIKTAKTTISNVVNSIKEKVVNVFNTIKSKVKAIWDGIKEAITAPIKKAKETVKGVIDTIKGLFPISIGKILSNISLPKFNWHWKKIVGNIKIPVFDNVSWNRRAYDNPYLFNTSTIIPTTSGMQGFGDGHGGEIVYGRRQLMRDIAYAAGNGGNTTINVYGAEGQSAKEIAEAVRKELIKVEKQRRSAWA